MYLYILVAFSELPISKVLNPIFLDLILEIILESNIYLNENVIMK